MVPHLAELDTTLDSAKTETRRGICERVLVFESQHCQELVVLRQASKHQGSLAFVRDSLLTKGWRGGEGLHPSIR